MKVITVRSQIRGLPGILERAWHRADGSWLRIIQNEPDTQKIHAAIAALDPETATVEDITKAMGYNGAWLGTKCHECGTEDVAVAQLGEEPDYESHTADICKKCLWKALNALAREDV